VNNVLTRFYVLICLNLAFLAAQIIDDRPALFGNGKHRAVFPGGFDHQVLR
jgi:hypothetical protein